MPGSNLDIRSKPNNLPARPFWTLALESQGVSPACYLTQLLRVDDDRWMALVGDYSLLASHIRMSPETRFFALSDEGGVVQGTCAIRVLGRVDELSSNKKSAMLDAAAQLQMAQQFPADDMILVELKMRTSEALKAPPSHVVELRT